MRIVSLFCCLFYMTILTSHAQTSQHFTSNSFQNYSDKWSRYKRTYDSLETNDYISNRLVLKAKFGADYGKEQIDGFLKYYRSNREDSVKAIKYAGIKAWITRFVNDTIDSEVQYVDSKRRYIKVYNEEGHQILDESGNGSSIEELSDGALYHEIYIDSVLRYCYRVEDNADTIHYRMDTAAKPVAGYQHFYNELVPKIEYPLKQKKMGLESSFRIRFVVDVTGSLGGFECENCRVPEFEKRIVRQLSKLDKWYPAMLDGKAVKSTYTLPVVFRLTD